MAKKSASSWRHRAFISYSQADKKSARQLQRWLEAYKLPKSVASGGRRKIGKLFRDETDLSGAADLGNALKEALDTSEGLIVLCSPKSAQSEWVDREIQHFRATGRTEQIFAVILSGVPNSDNPETECFPPSFRTAASDDPNAMPIEPLAVNPEADGRDRAYTRLAAGLFDAPFDDLWRREQRRQRRRMIFAGGLATTGAALLAAALIAGWFALSGFANLDRAQSEIVSREASEQFLGESGDHTKSLLLALQADPTATKSKIGALFNSDEGYALAKAQMVTSFLANRIHLKIKGDNQHATSVAFSPDGSKLLFTSLQGGYARVVDAESGELLHHFQQTSDDFSDATFSPDGKFIANNSKFPGVQLRPADGTADPRTLGSENADVFSLFTFSGDSSKIAIAWQKAVDIYDVETAAHLANFPFQYDLDRGAGDINALRFSDNDQYFAMGQSDGHVTVWDISSIDIAVPREPVEIFDLSTMSLPTKAAPFRTQLFFKTSDIDSDQFTYLPIKNSGRTLLVSHESVDVKAFAQDLSASASIDGTYLRVAPISASATTTTASLSVSDARIYSSAFSPDGNRLAIGLETGDVVVWDVSAPAPTAADGEGDTYVELDKRRAALSQREAYSQDGKLVAASVLPGKSDHMEDNFTDTILVISQETNQTLLELEGHERIEADLSEFNSLYFGWSANAVMMEFSPDGKFLGTIARDKKLHLWDLSDGTISVTLTLPELISSFAFSPQGDVIAVHTAGPGGEGAGAVTLWSTSTGQQLITLGAVDQALDGFGSPDFFSLDRSMVAFSEAGDTLLLLDSKSGKHAFPIPEFLSQTVEDQVAAACAFLKRGKMKTHFTKADITTFPSLAGEPIDPDTGIISSPCDDR